MTHFSYFMYNFAICNVEKKNWAKISDFAINVNNFLKEY